MSYTFSGMTILIAGAAGGIGQEVSNAFREKGAFVIGLDVRYPDQCNFGIVCDLGSDSSIAAAAEEVSKMGRSPAILVHTAAICETGSVLDTSPNDFARDYNINLISAVRLVQAFVPELEASGSGSIVFVSSVNAQVATPTLASYAASKSALDSLTKTLALELAEKNIRVNAVSPASVETSLLTDGFAAQDDPESARLANIKRHPIGRLGTPRDVAELILFLASEKASWITGGIYPVDGGALVTRR